MKIKWLVILIIVLSTLLLPQVSLAQLVSGQQITVREVAQVNEVGDVHLETTYTYPANYYTTAIAPSKVNPFLIPEIRFIRGGQSTKEIPRDSIKVDFADSSSSIKTTYDAMGFTVNKKDYWELEIPVGSVLASQNGTTVVLTTTQQQNNNTYLTTTTVTLPKDAKDIKVNSDTGRVRYTLADDSASSFPIVWAIVGGVVILLVVIYFAVVRKKLLRKT